MVILPVPHRSLSPVEARTGLPRELGFAFGIGAYLAALKRHIAVAHAPPPALCLFCRRLAIR